MGRAAQTSIGSPPQFQRDRSGKVYLRSAPPEAHQSAQAADYRSGCFLRTATAWFSRGLGSGCEVRSAPENGNCTSDRVINTLGKAVDGLSEHRVCPSKMIGNAYATHPSRNAAGEQEFQAPCTLAADLPLLNQTGPVLRRGPVVTRGHSLVAFYPGYPADWVRLSSGRTPSDTQADGVEACFGPGGLSMLASLRQNRGEYAAQGNSGLAAVRNPRKQSYQSVWW
jgi:hypothetical protein